MRHWTEPPTARELQILRYASHGYTDIETATILGISHKTVKTHVQGALRHMGLHSRTHAVAVCIRKGWIE